MLKLIKNKVVIALAIIVIIILSYVGLRDKNKEDISNTIRIATMGEPAVLDPTLVEGGTWEYLVIRDAFVGLFEKSADGKEVPALAESYEISKDGLVYTFHLRDSKWSDGEPVVAGDFEFAYKRMLDPKVPAVMAYFLFDIKNAEKAKEGKISLDQVGVKALDDKTLQIVLEKPVGYFLITLSGENFFPIPKHIVEKYGEAWAKPENIVTNGPYKIVERKIGSYVRAVKNDQYYDADKVKIDNIIYYTQDDRAAVLKRFRSGEIDIVEDFSADQYEWLKENYPNETKTSLMHGIIYVAVNIHKSPMDDIRVRRALAMAIDREYLVEKVLKTGEVPSYSLVPMGFSGYDPIRFDFSSWSKEKRIAEAKKLLSEAGYSSEKPLVVELAYSTDENDKKTFVAIANMWNNIGVKVNTNTREVVMHYRELRSQNFDTGRARWIGGIEDPAHFLSLFYSKIDLNYGLYNNKKFDELYFKGRATQNLEERNKIYAEAEKMVLDDVDIIPLYYYVSRTLVSQRVQGWVPNSSNKHGVKYMSLKEGK